MIAESSIETRIYAKLTDEIPDRIKISNSTMSDQARKFVEQDLLYKLEQWKKTGTFDILNNISEYVTLVQLMNSIGNMNHAVSVFGR